VPVAIPPEFIFPKKYSISMFPIVETEFRQQSDFLSDTPLQAYNVEKAEINVRMKIQVCQRFAKVCQ
jgi:hypothetical protein